MVILLIGVVGHLLRHVILVGIIAIGKRGGGRTKISLHHRLHRRLCDCYPDLGLLARRHLLLLLQMHFSTPQLRWGDEEGEMCGRHYLQQEEE